MYLSKKSTKRFCSNECQHIWQRGNTGFKNSRFKGGYVVCETCKKEFLVGQYIYESSRHHFCSQECRQAWYANVWSQSDEWRNESRARAASLMKTNKVKTQTRPQVLVNEFLEEMNVRYVNEKTYDYYSVDNYLIDQNLIIEVMGDYWHSSPLKYADKINDKQQYIISRDKAKNTYIKNYYNINILYLWEADIIKHPELCKKLIELYISNNGILENYHSFNYSFNHDSLALNKNIIIPKQELEKIAC